MKILFSYPSFYFTDKTENIGGEPRVAWETIRRVAQRGHKCFVVGPEIDLTKEYENIICYYIPKCSFRFEKKMKRKLIAFKYNVLSRKKIKKIIKKERIDIIHHLRPSYPGFFSLVDNLKVPFIYGPSTTKYSRIIENPTSRVPFFVSVYSSIKNRRWEKTLNNAKRILLEVKCARDWIPKKYWGKTIVLHNGIDTKKFRKSTTKKGNSKIKILYLAAVRKNKGADILLYAIKEIIKTNKNIFVSFVGKIFDYQYFYNIAQSLEITEYVDFVGSVSFEKIQGYYSQADIYCLPSLQDNSPNSLLEAMASGLPVVCSDVMGLPEVVENGKNGFLFQVGNYKECASALVKLCKNKQLRVEIGNRNINKMVREFDWENHVNKLLDIYYEVSKE